MDQKGGPYETFSMGCISSDGTLRCSGACSNRTNHTCADTTHANVTPANVNPANVNPADTYRTKLPPKS